MIGYRPGAELYPFILQRGVFICISHLSALSLGNLYEETAPKIRMIPFAEQIRQNGCGLLKRGPIPDEEQ